MDLRPVVPLIQLVKCSNIETAHAQKPDFVFPWSGRVHATRREWQFVRLLAIELCTSACRVCTARASLCSAVMWHLLVTHSILLFPPPPLLLPRATACQGPYQGLHPQGLRICGAIHPLLHMPIWRAQGLYRTPNVVSVRCIDVTRIVADWP